ncbi:hypothetical protein ACQPYK_48885 (plasmid) [Streptosporangium sp. CA-135522]|uniref:hypothetical protein n=1 Tax=Streptosporangium sp. CA-135522 TaxID=3240072 RepID=UPI003D93F9C8
MSDSLREPPRVIDAAAQLAALQQLYPGYHIEHDATLGRWTATRNTALSDRERAAKVKYVIIRAAPERLAAVLSDQVELAHRLRATHAFTGP